MAGGTALVENGRGFSGEFHIAAVIVIIGPGRASSCRNEQQRQQANLLQLDVISSTIKSHIREPLVWLSGQSVAKRIPKTKGLERRSLQAKSVPNPAMPAAGIG